MTAPERIWAGEGEYWGKPHIVNPTVEYVRHDAAALAASPVVQDMIRQAVEAERDACAAKADQHGNHDPASPLGAYEKGWIKGAACIAAAIRARKGE